MVRFILYTLLFFKKIKNRSGPGGSIDPVPIATLGPRTELPITGCNFMELGTIQTGPELANPVLVVPHSGGFVAHP